MLGLTIGAFIQIPSGKRHFDPDGIGPASRPEPGRFDAAGTPGHDPP